MLNPFLDPVDRLDAGAPLTFLQCLLKHGKGLPLTAEHNDAVSRAVHCIEQFQQGADVLFGRRCHVIGLLAQAEWRIPVQHSWYKNILLFFW